MNLELPDGIERFLRVDKVELVIGRALSIIVKDVEGYCEQSLPDYVRNQTAANMGWIMPEMKVSYSIALDQFSCQIKINGYVASQVRILPNLSLAIKQTPLEEVVECLDAGDIFDGYYCVWVDRRMVYKAIKQKAKVLSATDAFTKWLLTIISGKAQEIFGFEELQMLIDYGNKMYPATLNAALKNVATSTMLQVFQNLLDEGVSIKPLESIFNSMAIHGHPDCDSDLLTQQVRISLRNNICLPLTYNSECIYVVSIDPELEDWLLKQDYTKDIAEQPFAEELASAILAAVNEVTDSGFIPVILTNDNLRQRLSRLMRKKRHAMHILGYSEIPDSVAVETAYAIKPLEQQSPQASDPEEIITNSATSIAL